MRYIPSTAAQRTEMLRTIGVADGECLLERIPSKARLDRDLAIAPALAEHDLVAHVRALAAEDAHAGERFQRHLSTIARQEHDPAVAGGALSSGGGEGAPPAASPISSTARPNSV